MNAMRFADGLLTFEVYSILVPSKKLILTSKSIDIRQHYISKLSRT
jgi:hypothetical protein